MTITTKPESKLDDTYDSKISDVHAKRRVLLKRRQMIVVGMAAIIVVAGLVVYEAVLPAHYAKTYNKELKASSVSLERALKEVSDSTTRSVFTNPDSTTGSDKADLAIVQDKVDAASNSLKTFKTTANNLKNLPLSGYFGSYKQAKANKAKARDAAAKVDAGLNGYQGLVTFLQEATKINIQFEDNTKVLGEMETAVGANKLVSSLRDSAKALHPIAAAYAALKAPNELKSIFVDFAPLINDLADGFDALATAIEDQNTNDIVAAAQKIDGVTQNGDKLSKQLQEKFSQTSPLIKPVRDLPTLVSGLGL